MADMTTSSSVTEIVVAIWPPPLAGSIAFACVMFVGMVGNAIIIFTFLRSRQLRTPANIFYVNLAIADLGYNIFFGFLSISTLIHHGAIPFGHTGCFVQAALLCAATPAGFDCIGSIAISRYIIIVHPSKKYLTWGVCVGVCLLFCIPAFLFMIPNYAGWSKFVWLFANTISLWF